MIVDESQAVEIRPGDHIDNKRPTLVFMPHRTFMSPGARFVWGGAHYLVVSRTHHPRLLWLAPWTYKSRFLRWLGWGAWEDRTPYPCGECQHDVRRHRASGLCRDCGCSGFTQLSWD